MSRHVLRTSVEVEADAEVDLDDIASFLLREPEALRELLDLLEKRGAGRFDITSTDVITAATERVIGQMIDVEAEGLLERLLAVFDAKGIRAREVSA